MTPLETNYIKVWIEDDIMYVIYKNDVIIDLEAAKEIVNTRLSLSAGKDFNILCYFYNAKQFTEDAKKYFASKEACREIRKFALIVNSSFTKQAGNLFIMFNKPAVPVRLFTNEFEAIEWLKGKKLKLISSKNKSKLNLF